MSFSFQGIKSRVIALGLAACLGALLLRQFVVLPQFEARLLEVITEQQLALAGYVASDIDKAMTTRIALAERLAAEAPPLRDGLQHWLETQQRANPAFAGGLMVIRADGAGLLAEFPVVPGRAQRDFGNYPWFQKGSKSAGGTISQAAPVPLGTAPGIIFSAPLLDRTGKTVALLAAVALLGQDDFLAGFGKAQLSAGAELLLVSPADNLVLAASDMDRILKPANSALTSRWLGQSDDARRAGSVSADEQGVKRLSVMAAVPATGWLVMKRIRIDEALRPVVGLRTFLWSVTAGVFCTMLGLLIFGLRRILQPLVDTANALRDMADGKRALTTLPVARHDEVGSLVSGFNVLVLRLEREEAARKAGEERLEFMAHHDALTGLYNRAMLEDRMGLELARAERHGSQTALLFCDLDGFKEINDRHGHQAGDAVLCEVARRLSVLRRRADTVARLGGDEFVILLTDVKDARASAILVAQQCIDAMRDPFQVPGGQCSLGISIGIAQHDGPVVAPSALLDLADAAMYQAKRLGKGRYFFMQEIGVESPKVAAMGVSA